MDFLRSLLHPHDTPAIIVEPPVPTIDYRLAVIAVGTGVYLWEQYLSHRQYRRLLTVTKRTAELEPLLSEAAFKHTRAYSLDRVRFTVLQATYSHLVSVAMLMGGMLPWLWAVSGRLVAPSLWIHWTMVVDVLRAIFAMVHLVSTAAFQPESLSLTAEQLQYYEIRHSLIFLILLTLVNTAVNLPLSLYSTFVIEERHGFNKQSLDSFAMDLVKSLGLGAVLGLPIVAGFLAIIHATGDQFYFYVWLFVVVVQLVMLTIYPTLIQPLFNKVSPLPHGPLKHKIERLARSVKFPLTKLYVIDGSRRSAHSNAYFYGFGQNRRIVLFDTLLDQMEDHEQILAVLAHEIGHWWHSHTFWRLVVAQVQLFVLFALFSQFVGDVAMFRSFGFDVDSEGAYLPTIVAFMLFSFVYAPVDALLQFMMNVLSRHNEFQADRYAASKGYAIPMRQALLKLSVSNKGMLWPDAWYASWHYSHPPVVQRIEALGGIEEVLAFEQEQRRRNSSAGDGDAVNNSDDEQITELITTDDEEPVAESLKSKANAAVIMEAAKDKTGSFFGSAMHKRG